MIRTDSDRPSVQFDEDAGEWHFRASALGLCEMRLVLTGQEIPGEPTPESMLAKYAEGHAAEDTIRGFSLDRGKTRRSAARTAPSEARRVSLYVELENYKGAWINGEVDDLHYPSDGEGWIEEYKALGVSYGQKLAAIARTENNAALWEVLPRSYSWQAAVYMHATNKPLHFVVGVKNTDGLVVDADQVLGPWVFTEPPHTREEIYEKVARIVNAIDGRGEMPKCPTPTDFPCPYYKLHDDDDEIPIVKPGEREAFVAAYQARANAVALANLAKRRKEDAEAEIAKLLGDRKKVQVPREGGGAYLIGRTVSPVKGGTVVRKPSTRVTWTFKELDD